MFEEEDEETAYCPSCDSPVPADAAKCPECGAEFELGEVEEVIEEGKPEEIEEEKAEELEEEGAEVEEVKTIDKLKHLTRDRIFFYLGIILIMAGGPGLAFGSWLHDWFRVPIMGDSYGVFGQLNVLFAIGGLIIMFVGIVFLVLSMRGGVITKEDIKELKAEV